MAQGRDKGNKKQQLNIALGIIRELLQFVPQIPSDVARLEAILADFNQNYRAEMEAQERRDALRRQVK